MKLQIEREGQNSSCPQRVSFESFTSWIARSPAIAPFFGLPKRLLDQAHLNAEALQELIGGVEHPNPKVRWECAHLMDHLADDRCIEALLRLSQDEIPRVRAEALHALGCIRCKSCPLNVDAVALLANAALNDPGEKVRSLVVFTLGYLPPDPRAAAALRQVAQEDSDIKIRTLAKRALKYHESAG
jgi:HEAT repeat protein